MSLKYLVDILPSSESLDKSLSPYESSTLTLGTFSSSVGYIQRALLGYDSSNPYACLAVASLGRPLTEPKCHINYLPVELLREIFILCLPDETWTHLLNASDPPAPYPPCQLTLSQVCSYWRRVALSFPDLWSTIIVISPGPCHVPLVELWLERSGQLPLTFYIDNRNCDTWEKECASITAAEDVIYLLRPHVRRWKSATFKLFARLQPLSWSAAHPSGCLSLLESLMGLPSDCFSLLETLHFDVDEYLCRYHSESIKQIGEMFLSSSLTQLKEVEWKTRKFLHHDTLVFPANLTHLSGDFVLDTSFLSALSELKNLHFLRLNGSCNWDRFRYEQPLTLDKLHTLDLRTATSTQCLLNLIVAPNLTVLAIGTPFPEDNYAALPLFLTRCRCNLKTFSYFSSTAYLPTYPSSTDSELRFWRDLFLSPCVDSLSELNVECASADPLLTALSWTNPEKPILPLLSRLWLSIAVCSIGTLFDMLEYRVHRFQVPVGPAMSEGTFEGVYLSANVTPPPPGRSLSIHTPRLENNGSRSPAELYELIEKNAHRHIKITVPMEDGRVYYYT